MKLQSLAEGTVHHVWAVANDNGDCQVMEKLREVAEDHLTLANDMASLVFQYVPVYGLPWHDGSRLGKLYADEIYEFKACEYVNKRKTVALRVAFFLDPDTDVVVVCTNAFYKEAGKTPSGVVQMARQLRQEYLAAKRSGIRELLEDEP